MRNMARYQIPNHDITHQDVADIVPFPKTLTEISAEPSLRPVR
ncbi:hypothetical protein [Acidomonas methanolica]|nr:hypothetical protein [Acidomonas methanolica]